MPIPNKDSIAGRLLQAAEARTWELGLHFHSEVSFRMKELADRGANTILAVAKNKSDWMAERYARGATRVGSGAMVVFVDEMAIARLTTPDYVKTYGTELRGDIWTKVHDVLCPLWPIC
jgi:hypothetical protein